MNKLLLFITLVLALVTYIILFLAFRMRPAWRDVDTYEIITKKILPQRSPRDGVFPVVACQNNRTQVRFVIDQDRIVVGGVSNYSSLFRREILDQVAKKKHGNFLPSLSDDVRRDALLLYQAFAQRMTNRSVPFFFVSGSLLGASRHQGFIPWDDDIDVGVDIADFDATRDALSCVAGFHFRRFNDQHWKWSTKEKNNSVFVDIFFYAADANYVWALNYYVSNTFLFKKDDVFPLSEAVFEGIKVPVPKRHTALAYRSFHFNLCFYHENHLKRNKSWAAQYPKDVFAKTIVECKVLAYLYNMHHLEDV